MTGSRRRPCRSRGRGALASIGIVVLVTLGAACSPADETEPLPRDTPQVGADDAIASVPDEGGEASPDDVPPGEAPQETSPPDDTARETSPPDDSVLEELIPDGSAPTTSIPEEVPGTSAPPGGESSPATDGSAADEPDDDVDPALVTLAVAGFLVLVGLAAWWMLGRDDPDAEVGRQDRNDWPDDHMSI